MSNDYIVLSKCGPDFVQYVKYINSGQTDGLTKNYSIRVPEVNGYLTGTTLHEFLTSAALTISDNRIINISINGTSYPIGSQSGGGSVTSVQVQAEDGLTSSDSALHTTTLNTIIGVDNNHKLPTITEWGNKQDKIDTDHKINADYISDGNINKTITQTEKTDIANNTSARHEHTNKSILDAIADTDITNWNSKQDALASQTAYSSKGSSTKVPQITTNSLGQVTEITEVDISFPSVVTSFGGKTGAVTVSSNFTFEENQLLINGNSLFTVNGLDSDDDVSAPSFIENGTSLSDKYYLSSNPSGYTSNIGTITGITMNDTSKGTSGVVNLGTVLTSHQDISGKLDKTGGIMSGSLGFGGSTPTANSYYEIYRTDGDTSLASENRYRLFIENDNDIDYSRILFEPDGTISVNPCDVTGGTTGTAKFKYNDEEVVIKTVTDDLQVQINNLKSIGRFLAVLNVANGTVSSQPSGEVESSYYYKVGDYYRVTGTGTYEPNPSSTFIITTAAEAGHSNFTQNGTTYNTGDVIYCSNISGSTSTWVRQTSGGGETVQDVTINSNSILSSGVAKIIVDGNYDESTNKIATEDTVSNHHDSTKQNTITSSTSLSLAALEIGDLMIDTTNSLHYINVDSSLKPDLNIESAQGNINLVVPSGKTVQYTKGTNTYEVATVGANLSSFTNDSGFITSSALSSYLPKSGGRMTGNLEMTHGNTTLQFREDSENWYSGMYYHTNADEAMVFMNKGKDVNGSSNYSTSWIFAYGNPLSRTAWTELSPVMQIKENGVAINKLIGSRQAPSYNLDVNGTIGGTTIYENGVSLASKYLTSHQDISGKADKTSTVTNVEYNTTNKKFTKTINGTTTDIVATSTILGAMTSSNVTTALGYTPYNSTNPNGYTSNIGTITGITMNGSSKGTTGIIDLGTVITDVSGKLNKSGDTMTGLLITTTGASHAGTKHGNTYITSINGDLIFQNNSAIRFGGDSWDYNVWGGLKYTHSNKTIHLGIADGAAFTANSPQTDGTLNLANIKTININSGSVQMVYDSSDNSLEFRFN